MNATSKLVKAWESKNAKNAARAGGVSLMALSLAACGGSSDTVDITSDNAAAIAAALTDANGTLHADVAAAIAAGVSSVDITTDNAAAITGALTGADGTVYADVAAAVAAGVTSVDITTDNAAAITGALTGADGTVYADVAAAVAAGVTSVDITTDNATAATTALRNAAAELGVTGTSVMTDAELITAIKTANDTAIANGVDLTTDNTAAIDAAVVALGISGISTLAQLNTAYDLLANPASLVLTTSVDSLTGTTGADTFTADNTGTDVTSTADTVNGGDGTDTLNIFSDGAAAGLPALTSVETVNFYDQDADFTMAATAQAGVTTVGIIRGDGDVTLTLASGNETVNITDVALAGTGVILTADAADTSITLGLASLTAAGASANEDVHLNGAAITTVTVNNTASSTMDALDLDAATAVTLNASAAFTTTGSIETTGTSGTLTIEGAGAVDLSAIDVGFTTVNGSTMTGALTAEIGTNDDQVLTSGSGNDVITANTTDALAAADALAVNAGDGIDTLVIAATADVNTAADGARYTNFETIRTADSHNMSLVSGVVNLEITGGTSETYSNLSTTQAQNITFTADNTTSTIFSFATDTNADSIKITTASGTATTDVDLIGINVDNIETVTFNLTTGTNSTGDTAIGFLANSADEVTTLNFLGTADTTFTVAANTLDVAAVTINASGMTGTADFTLVQTSDLVTGSSVTGTANADTIALGTTTGSTYNGGNGDDGFSTVAATLAATGANDSVVNGGDGIDTLTITDDGSTMTDNHFTYVSNMEKITYSDGGAVSLTTGSAFQSAFTSGVTVTATGMDDAATFTYAGGIYTGDTTVTLTSSGLGNATGENLTVTTGAGSDTVTVTASSWVGVAGDTSAIVLTTGTGADTISLTGHNLAANTTTIAIQIDAGTGADTITLSGDNGAGATAYANFTINGDDSTLTAYDNITGFEVGDGTNYSSGLDFDGTSAKATAVTADAVAGYTSAELTMTISSAGIVTFSGTSASGLSVADVLGILDLEITTSTHTALWTDGTDSYVFNANTTGDSVVHLVGLTGVDALITSAGLGANDLLIA